VGPSEDPYAQVITGFDVDNPRDFVRGHEHIATVGDGCVQVPHGLCRHAGVVAFLTRRPVASPRPWYWSRSSTVPRLMPTRTYLHLSSGLSYGRARAGSSGHVEINGRADDGVPIVEGPHPRGGRWRRKKYTRVHTRQLPPASPCLPPPSFDLGVLRLRRAQNRQFCGL
jgi:hypothetical protein